VVVRSVLCYNVKEILNATSTILNEHTWISLMLDTFFFIAVSFLGIYLTMRFLKEFGIRIKYFKETIFLLPAYLILNDNETIDKFESSIASI